MTVLTSTAKESKSGNGVTTVFPFTVVFFANSHIVVTKVVAATSATTLWTEGVQYSLTGAGSPAGGTLTTLGGFTLATGEFITIVRDVPATQAVDLVPNGALPADTLERALDKLTMLAQDLDSNFAGTLRLNSADTAVDLDPLPLKATLANKFLAFDGNGDPMAAAGTSASLGPVTAFIDTLLDDVDAPTARTTLGAAGLTDANVFTANQLIRTTDAGATEGPLLTLDRNSVSPEVSDLIGALVYSMRTSTAATRTAAKILAQILDATDASEDTRIQIQTQVAGTLATRVYIGQGLSVGNVADPGPGAILANTTVSAQNGYLRAGVALPIQLQFESAQQTITLAGNLTIPHGLPAKPKLYMAVLQCVTAELGYSVGDETPLIDSFASSQASSIVPDTVNINVRFANGAIGVSNKTTGVSTTITPANWRLVVRAWV